MCLLCSASTDSAPLCPLHEKDWQASPEFRRVEWFRSVKDKRLPALSRTALADFIDRTLKERANGTPEVKP